MKDATFNLRNTYPDKFSSTPYTPASGGHSAFGGESDFRYGENQGERCVHRQALGEGRPPKGGTTHRCPPGRPGRTGVRILYGIDKVRQYAMRPVRVVVGLMCCMIIFSGSLYGQVIKPDDYDWSAKPENTPVNKQFSDASAVVMKDVRLLYFYYEKEQEKKKEKEALQSEVIVHKIIKINDERAIESYNKLYIPLADVLDIIDIKARTISPDGKINDLDKNKIKEIKNKEGEGEYKIFAFEGLEKGGTLEYLYRLKKDVDYSFRIRIQSDDPVQFEQVSIICPENLKFDYKVYNGSSVSTDTVLDDVRYDNIIVKDIPGRTEEKYSAYEADLMRVEIQLAYNSAVGKSRILSYSSAAQRLYPRLYDNDTKAQKKIEKLSDEIGLSKLKPEDKVKHIENYIKTNIQQVKIPSTDYEDVSKIIQSKIANTTGLIRLYLHLFSANRINCQVVYTTDRSKVAFDPEFETWNYLDDILFYFPGFDKYLAPMDNYLRYPMIPATNMLNYGLFIEEVAVGTFKSATGTVKLIPANPPEQNGEVIEAYCRLNPTLDSVDITFTRYFLGQLASGSRYVYNYSQKEDKKKILDELVKFCMKDAKIESEDLKNSDFLDEEKPLEVTGQISGTALIEQSGKDILFKAGDLIGPQAELYQEKERQTGVDVFFAHHFTRTLKIEIPKGYKASGLDALKMNVKFDYDGKDACGFISDYKVEGNLLTINVFEYYYAIQLPKEQFENFRKVVDASADFNKVNIVFEKI